MQRKDSPVMTVLLLSLLVSLVLRLEISRDMRGSSICTDLDINTTEKTISGTLYRDAVYIGAVPGPTLYTTLDTMHNAHQATPFLRVVWVIAGTDTLGYYPID
jgi:hypothetical protein